MTDVAEQKVLGLDDILSDRSVDYARVRGFKEGQVFVIRSLTAGDLIEWSEASDGHAKREAGLRLIVKSLVDGEPGVDKDATGKLIMKEEHIPILRAKQHKVTERIVKEIITLNGMTVGAQSEVKKD